MLLIVDHSNRAYEHLALRSMFEARKRVFIDLLKWDVPALADRFELDQFDDIYANYLIVTDRAGQHLASARLLPTVRPALLGSLYPDLADSRVPEGEDILEITRFCLSPGIGARDRRVARDVLLVGLVEYALANGVRTYIGVAELPWFRQIERFGWDCRALAEPKIHDGRALVGLAIDVDATTASKLAINGITGEAVLPPAAAA
ncbi:acyl-homoserine-lactone synthase [Sphingopyxis sp.]|jgi:acyl-homoserine lactone synthase|uniref:acyl-homoserine-lactone synthase n=1 Tax=Sphingopyxis sp. TaxID=1908224 RepID=UPI002DEF3CB4|nr:acyl-homoserine-lactone synthase [Sphingopyxis sp.]